MPVKLRWLAYVYGAAFLQIATLAGCQHAKAPSPSGDAQNAAVPITVEQEKEAKLLVLAFGDSLYAGYGLKPGEDLPSSLQNRLRASGMSVKIVNGGISGDTTASGRKRLAFTLDALSRKPDLVLLGLGGNDVLRQIAADETRGNMVAMLKEIQRRNIPVILTGMRAPPNLGPDYGKQFDAIYPDLAKSFNAPLDPFVLNGVIGNRKLMLPDGLHPNASGVDVMAARVAPLIAQALK
jgi:acyl-CoA thioesterase I